MTIAILATLAAPVLWTLVAVLGAGVILASGLAGRRLAGAGDRRRSRPPVMNEMRGAEPERGPGAASSAAPAEDAMTVSEEQLVVDKRQRPRERVRLQKHVVTEYVTVRVQVRREEVRFEREPIGEAEAAQIEGGGPAEMTMILMEEEPVVQKRIVPRERVWLGKEVVAGEQEITDVVRREQVEVEQLPVDPTVQQSGGYPRS